MATAGKLHRLASPRNSPGDILGEGQCADEYSTVCTA